MTTLRKLLPLPLIVLLLGWQASWGPAGGAVLWTHDSAGVWSVTKPDGTRLDITRSTSGGLQEALDYAFVTPGGYPLIGYGGAPSPGNSTTVVISAPVAVPPGAILSADFYGMNWACTTTGSQDCIVFDSQDMLHWDMHHSQVWMAGKSTGAVWRIGPQHNNGETINGFTASDVYLGETFPGPVGTGVRFTPAYNSSCCAAGHGLIVNNKRLSLGNIKIGRAHV